MPDMSSPKVWAVAGVCILVAGAGAWGILGRNTEPPSTLPKELSAEALKEKAKDPGTMWSTMRETMHREDLTDEQRRELHQNMRQAMRERMQERVDEYFAADADEQEALLDQAIDEFAAQAKEWEARRKEWEKNRKAEGKDGREGERPPRGMFGQRSQAERKAQSESRNPDEMARMMAYFSAMRKRAEARGIRMPRGPGRGGFGGPGGGRGGRGGPGGGHGP